MLNTDWLKEFSDIENQEDELEAKLKVLKDRKKMLIDPILDNMIDEGIDNIRINGRTIYIKSEIWAKVLDKEKALDVLKEAGMDEYIRTGYNHQSLSAYVREQIKNGEELPEAFKGVIGANETQKVVSRKS